MLDTTEWLKEKYAEQSETEKEYFGSFVEGVLLSEINLTPDKEFTVSEVLEIVKLINKAHWEVKNGNKTR